MSPVLFSSLNLSAELQKAVQLAGFKHPTPIQSLAIPVALEGKDLIGCAATGTGKTAAFALPILERLQGESDAKTMALVLAPTRELALQIEKTFVDLTPQRRVRCATLIGGVSMRQQLSALKTSPTVLIATPGRLIDHLNQGTARIDTISVLVLDEADRMLDMGFKPQLTRIMAKVPRVRQTMLFSATMGGEVAEFAKKHLRHPVRVEVTKSGTTAARATQRLYEVSQIEKAPLLLTLVKEDPASTLVFTRTKRRADKLARVLEREGMAVARIHSDRSQAQRQHALEGFRRGQYQVLVATDIAARGIDVADIGHVVNYDLPHVSEDYVHRIGRTARAAASGLATSFTTSEDSQLLADIERFIGQRVPRAEIPRDSKVFQSALKLAVSRQADPGPPSADHRISGRNPGAAPGRHAKSHPKKAHAGSKSHAARPPRTSAPRNRKPA